MGHLIYGVAPAINIDDCALHHLRAVIVTKLGRDPPRPGAEMIPADAHRLERHGIRDCLYVRDLGPVSTRQH